MKKILAYLMLTMLVSSTVFAGGGNGPASTDSDEIYLIVLDDLFLQAGEKWKVEADQLWDDYARQNIAVKRISPEDESGQEEYELVSPEFGKLLLKVSTQAGEASEDDDFSLSDFMNDAESNSAENAESSN